MAIIFLFSAFESIVRDQVRLDLEAERHGITHPILQFAAEEALFLVNRGSFDKVLNFLKKIDHHLVEQVRQIRRYLNWVSHGKRGKGPFELSPRDAFDRLNRFLDALGT